MIISLEAWVKVEPSKVRFLLISDNDKIEQDYEQTDSEPQYITGEQYLKLSEEEQNNYILECANEVFSQALQRLGGSVDGELRYKFFKDEDE